MQDVRESARRVAQENRTRSWGPSPAGFKIVNNRKLSEIIEHEQERISKVGSEIRKPVGWSPRGQLGGLL